MCIDLGALAINSGRRSLNGRPADLHDDDFRLPLRTRSEMSHGERGRAAVRRGGAGRHGAVGRPAQECQTPLKNLEFGPGLTELGTVRS